LTTEGRNNESPFLKKVFLQFFLQELSGMKSLVALILRLAGCTDEEVQVTNRK
jgi:hypothetical protein